MGKAPEITDQDEGTLQSKAVAVVQSGPTGVMIGGKLYKAIEQVNVPTLKHETGETVAVQIMAPIVYSEKEVEKEVTVNGQKVMAKETVGINVVRVTELSSGQLFNLVLNAISASEFNDMYPDHGYVNQCFAIRKLGLVAGKRYKDVQIIRIEHDGEL